MTIKKYYNMHHAIQYRILNEFKYLILYYYAVINKNKIKWWIYYHFLISVLPEQPVILDRLGRTVNGSIGPEKEGDDLILTCRVTGGKLKLIFI